MGAEAQGSYGGRVSGRDPNEIRRELAAAGRKYAKALARAAEADQQLGRLLADAQGTIPMTEAARLAGIGRPLAYKLAKRTDGS